MYLIFNIKMNKTKSKASSLYNARVDQGMCSIKNHWIPYKRNRLYVRLSMQLLRSWIETFETDTLNRNRYGTHSTLTTRRTLVSILPLTGFPPEFLICILPSFTYPLPNSFPVKKEKHDEHEAEKESESFSRKEKLFEEYLFLHAKSLFWSRL